MPHFFLFFSTKQEKFKHLTIASPYHGLQAPPLALSSEPPISLSPSSPSLSPAGGVRAEVLPAPRPRRHPGRWTRPRGGGVLGLQFLGLVRRRGPDAALLVVLGSQGLGPQRHQQVGLMLLFCNSFVVVFCNCCFVVLVIIVVGAVINVILSNITIATYYHHYHYPHVINTSKKIIILNTNQHFTPFSHFRRHTILNFCLVHFSHPLASPD